MSYDTVLCGLGGQGIIFAGRLLSFMAMKNGWGVIGAETHGMAQRGGSVVAHLRFGETEGSLVPEGSADALIALSEEEAYRNLALAKRGGLVFVNAKRFPVKKAADYVKKTRLKPLVVDADTLAVQNGLPRAVNLIVLGFACATGELPFSLDDLKQAVKAVARERFWEANFRAIELGASRA